MDESLIRMQALDTGMNAKPMTDSEIETLITGDSERPRSPGFTYVNWWNDYPNLADRLVESDDLRSEILQIAREIAREALYRDNRYVEPTETEVIATALRTLFCPRTNVGTRTNFLRGAIAEANYAETLETEGYTVLDTDTVERITGESPYTQEKTNGWDIVARGPDMNLYTFQIKATKDKPDESDKKKADNLIWFEYENGSLKEPKNLY